MTRIDFHVNLADPIGYGCRLLRKACIGAGIRAVVVGPDEQLEALDQRLWTFSDVDFIAHERLPAGRVAATPLPSVWLVPAVADELPRELLINLLETVPAGFESFERLIELVPLEERGRATARQRWRHYTDRGYRPVKHEPKPGGGR